jgi:thiosulfate/3-mercaptopyruvate sulfurtransferase
MWMMRHLFETRGASSDKEIVLYEETSGMRAARALWFLEYFGHPSVRLLDGGIQSWKQAGCPVTTDALSPRAGRLKTPERPDILATADDVLKSLNQKSTVVLDTRSDDEYMGKNIRAARGGAIPGAVHLEWTQNLDRGGKFKPDADLATLYRGLGITQDKEIIPYCQGGYRSSHSYLALRLIGFPEVRNYIGSWKEWGDRPDLPIEKPWEK